MGVFFSVIVKYWNSIYRGLKQSLILKGKKKKKKEPPPPPAVGPWIHKLHVADNGIDGLAFKKELAPLQMIRILKKYVHYLCLDKLRTDIYKLIINCFGIMA